jgi:hypothetical protein
MATFRSGKSVNRKPEQKTSTHCHCLGSIVRSSARQHTALTTLPSPTHDIDSSANAQAHSDVLSLIYVSSVNQLMDVTRGMRMTYWPWFSVIYVSWVRSIDGCYTQYQNDVLFVVYVSWVQSIDGCYTGYENDVLSVIDVTHCVTEKGRWLNNIHHAKATGRNWTEDFQVANHPQYYDVRVNRKSKNCRREFE